MFVLAEFFPLFCGITIGVFLGNISSIRLRRATWIGLSLLCGLVANLLSGEAWALLLFDALFVALCAQAVALLQKFARNAQA